MPGTSLHHYALLAAVVRAGAGTKLHQPSIDLRCLWFLPHIDGILVGGKAGTPESSAGALVCGCLWVLFVFMVWFTFVRGSIIALK